MASSRKPARRTFADHFQATFGRRLEARKLRSRTLLAMGVVAVLSTGAASADWRVYDSRVKGVLEQIRDGIGKEESVNEKLKDLNTKLRIDLPANGTTKDMVAEPTGEEKLDKQNPTQASADTSRLCPAGGGLVTTPLAQQQQILCQEIVKTELAQYRFSMRMFERSKEQYDRLKEIEDERRNSIRENDYADLQDNTNKLLALTALMDNDRDRYRTYMSAYDARIAYIRHVRGSLTRNAFTGKGGSPGRPPGP